MQETPSEMGDFAGRVQDRGGGAQRAARLAKQGIANVRVLGRGPQSQRFAYRFRAIDTEIRNAIVEAGRGMPAAVLHSLPVDH